MSKRRFPFSHFPSSNIHSPISNIHSPSSIFRFIRRYVPWGVIDALVVIFSLLLAWSARAITATLDLRPALLFGLVAVAICLGVNYLLRLYHRLWRYASAGEIVVIAAAVVISTALLTLADIFWPDQRPVPLSVVWMTGLFAFVGFVSVRYRRRVWTGVRWRWRDLRRQFPAPGTRVLIVGAGEAGQLLAWRFLNQKEGEGYKVVGFVDDDPAKQGMRVHGLPVLGDCHAIPDLVARHGVDLIVIAIYNIAGDDFRAILDLCEQSGAIIKVLPNIFDFLQKREELAPLRDVTAEDLLGRKPVEIDHDACRDLLAGKTVLVTGAAGSIGSELCRQIIAFGPRQLLMLDNNETGLHDLWVELNAKGHQVSLQLLLGSITNRKKIGSWFETYRPQIIFHAAAYKHVPLMEEHPDESVWVNVAGTLIASELAHQIGAERFVLVSTDKAVNPCSIMGATKRLCEMMIVNGEWRIANGESAIGNRKSKILCTAVRFGNVLGSRGSVVPTFEWQIEMGGPVTVTDRDMTRYFMSVSEAVSLIIQAAALTEGGDIFMLDMGQQICIDELARRLIRLRGLRPDVDIRIAYIGPRLGEKMHEELLGDGEERETTPHPHIFRVRSSQRETCNVKREVLDELIALAEAQRNGELVERLRELVLTPALSSVEGI
ncbi:MAG: polysaccharide biosynthesis protein [Chloroflexi bacterium]|nr:polysaccharide biosynthesis protein [Chloroflexota bacterium]